MAKKLAFFVQNTVNFCNVWIVTLVFKKNTIFFVENWRISQKIVIITLTPHFDNVLSKRGLSTFLILTIA
jgi:hypothetical protein